MNYRKKCITAAISLILIFATARVYTGVSFAALPQLPILNLTATVPQHPTGVVSTQANQAITLNGVAAMSGATVLSGASIETPNQVGATIDLGSLGSVEIDPNTKLTITFQDGSIKLNVQQGCVILRTKPGTSGEVATSQGVRKTESANPGVIQVCAPGAVPVAPVPVQDGGLSTTAVGAIIAVGIGIPVAAGLIQQGPNAPIGAPVTAGTRGVNPSPTFP